MRMRRSAARRGFSLVELLAVVLILAVLAAVAVPLYLNTRKTSAARACKANINAIASAEAARALRDGQYVPLASLVGGGPEGLSGSTLCPLNRTAYAITTGGVGGAALAAGTTLEITIACPNAGTHATDLGAPAVAAEWQRSMAAIGGEAGIP